MYFRFPLREMNLFLGSQLEFQTFRDSFCDFVLNLQEVGKSAIVLFAPKLRSVGNIHQFAPDDQLLVSRMTRIIITALTLS